MTITGTPDEIAALAEMLRGRDDQAKKQVSALETLLKKEITLKNGEKIIPFENLTEEEKIAGIQSGFSVVSYDQD